MQKNTVTDEISIISSEENVINIHQQIEQCKSFGKNKRSLKTTASKTKYVKKNTKALKPGTWCLFKAI